MGELDAAGFLICRLRCCVDVASDAEFAILIIVTGLNLNGATELLLYVCQIRDRLDI